MIYLLRRKRLGHTSCRKIVDYSDEGIGMFRNDVRLPQADLIFRWGCTSPAPSRNIVNVSEAIHRVSDKRGFRMMLQEEHLCPETWIDPRQARFPCIVRPQFHHQGRRLYLCQTREDLWRALEMCQNPYISAYIDKVAEFRVFVVQGRVVCVAQKHPGDPRQIAWNVFQGAHFENVRWKGWPLPALRVAVMAMRLSGLDFGGVDVMIDRGGSATVLEINSAPSLTSAYRQQCFAKAFDAIVRDGKAPLEIGRKELYTSFIHPAVKDGQ